MTTAMMVNLKHIFKYIGRRSILPSSRVFVSVSVVNAMPRAQLSRRSTKVIIKVSIWTCVILVLLFLVVYTILLVCVNRQMLPAQFDVPYKKIRLLGRINSKNRYTFVKSYLEDNLLPEKTDSHRTAVWNSSLYYHQEESPPSCRQQAFITVLVTSSPENSDRRMAIRKTWCNHQHFSAAEQAWNCIFLVGISSSDEINFQTRRERTLYNDILVGSYIDSYRNLTLKVIHGFNWSTNYCPSSYVVKTDDDCFVNTGLLHDFLLKYNLKKHDLYAGRVVKEMAKLKVIRGAEKKWAVGYDEYSEEYYPPYASGIGYVLSADVVKKLVSESAFIKPIPNEDAYVGIVTSHLGVIPVSSNRFVLSSSGLNVCNFLYVFIVHHVQTDVQAELLNKTVESQTSCHHPAIATWN